MGEYGSWLMFIKISTIIPSQEWKTRNELISTKMEIAKFFTDQVNNKRFIKMFVHIDILWSCAGKSELCVLCYISSCIIRAIYLYIFIL